MSAYVIVQVNVTDWEKFRSYLQETPRVIARYGGGYLARGGETATLEGEKTGRRVVLIEFPTLQRAKDWYGSEEYRQIKPLREGAATATIIAVEGC